MTTLKELLTNAERTKYEMLKEKMKSATSIVAVKYYEWRAHLVLIKAERRIQKEKEVSRKDKALFHV